jgi:hypothetical protein
MFTSLQHIIDQGVLVSTDTLNQPGNEQAALELQTRLCDLGILDPEISGDANTPFGPVRKGDGKIGLNTRAAIREFCRLAGLEYEDGELQPALLQALVRAQRDTFLPVQFEPSPQDDPATAFAKRILRYMAKKQFWIARSPDMYNIVYVEGCDPDGRKNWDAFNHWNDRRIVVRILPGGQPVMEVNDLATTEPGHKYTQSPLNPQGAARIAFGQYKAWVDGLHRGVQPALVQRQNIKVHRDLNKDGLRNAKDPIDIGRTFFINQHSTEPGSAPRFVGAYSAGCLVGRRYNYHQSFMEIVRRDVRYKQNKGYLFITTILAGDDLEKEEPLSIPGA